MAANEERRISHFPLLPLLYASSRASSHRCCAAASANEWQAAH